MDPTPTHACRLDDEGRPARWERCSETLATHWKAGLGRRDNSTERTPWKDESSQSSTVGNEPELWASCIPYETADLRWCLWWRIFLDSEHHYEWLPPCPSAFSSCVGTRLKRMMVHYSSGVSGNKRRLTERRTWFFIQSVSVRSRRNHLNVSNLARKIEEPPILSCSTMSHTMVSSRDVLWRMRLFLFPFSRSAERRSAIYRVHGRVTAQLTESGGDCFSRVLCLPLVCAVSVLHILCLCWLKLSSQWKNTHWVQGVVTSCYCLVFDFQTLSAETLPLAS